MKLYQLPYSHNCAKVRITLLEKGLAFEAPELPPGFTRSPEFLALNPLGKVPFLQDGPVALGESEVIVEYLEDRYRDPSLLPADIAERAESRWLSRYHDLYLGPQLSTLFFALSDGRAGTPAFAPEVDRLLELVSILEARIRPCPYFLGPQFTLSDAAYVLSYHYVVTLSAAHGRPLTAREMPRLAAWFEAVSRRPSAAAALDAARVALDRG